MTELPRSVLLASFFRSFAVQASWNYRTLVGCGFAFTIMPVLRAIYAQRPNEFRAAVQRHTAVFNSHPYFALMAVGAVAVLESTESPELAERFKSAVRGSLGSLGDRLIWTGFRPLCALVAIAAVLLGAGWLVVSVGFLVVYNIGHVITRVWALRFGLRHGRRLGEQLRNVPVERLQSILHNAATFMLGVGLVLVLAGKPLSVQPNLAVSALGAAAAIAGAVFDGRVRMPVVLGLTASALLGVVIGVVS